MVQLRLQGRPLPLLLLLIAASPNASSSQNYQPPKSQQPQQPIGDVLYSMLDKDKNSKVTMSEVNAQIIMLDNLIQGAAAMEQKENDGLSNETDQNKKMLDGLKSAAPTIFKLLDSNGDQGLTKAELKYVTKFEKSFKKDGGMRNFVRDVFGILDNDGDDQLSADELLEASQSDNVITKVSASLHGLFPGLRKTPEELEYFVKDTFEAIGGRDLDKDQVASGIKMFDEDGDGYIQRKEVGKQYNFVGKMVLETCKTIKQIGPMLAMFGGMDMNAMGGMGGGGAGGFKMDL